MSRSLSLSLLLISWGLHRQVASEALHVVLWPLAQQPSKATHSRVLSLLVDAEEPSLEGCCSTLACVAVPVAGDMREPENDPQADVLKPSCWKRSVMKRTILPGEAWQERKQPRCRAQAGST